MGKSLGQLSRPPDTNTSLRLAAQLQSCGRAGYLRLARRLHARFALSGAAAASAFLTNHLITMYSHCADVRSALRLFHAMPRPNLVSWTTLISGLAQNSMHRDALAAFASMRRAGLAPTQFALSSAARAAAALAAPVPGAQLHCVGVRLGFDGELFVASNLADMYSISPSSWRSIIAAWHIWKQMNAKIFDSISPSNSIRSWEHLFGREIVVHSFRFIGESDQSQWLGRFYNFILPSKARPVSL